MEQQNFLKRLHILKSNKHIKKETFNAIENEIQTLQTLKSYNYQI